MLFDLRRSRLQSVLHTLYALIFCLAICGNSLVMFVVVTMREMHSVTNYFIANLAIADILQVRV